MKGSVYMAITVDGKIARSDGDMSFLNDYPPSPDDGDMGFTDFLNSVDVILMGRKTFDTVLGFGVEQYPYGEIPIHVLTSRQSNSAKDNTQLPDYLRDKVSYSALSPTELWLYLDGQGYRHAYIDGGKVVQSFIHLGLIDEITLTTVPMILGSGISLFADERTTTTTVSLHRVHTKVFSNGLVQNMYRTT